MSRPQSIDLALHSCRLRYLHDPAYDVFGFIDDAAARGFTGVNISLSGPDNDRLPPNRHLTGNSRAHLDAVAVHLRKRRLSLELDTDTVDPVRLGSAIEIARHLGAKVLRTFTHHRYGPTILPDTVRDLHVVSPVAEQAGVVVAVENHEEFTSAELARLVAEVDNPWVRLLYDYGNSLAVLEPPHVALEAMRPYVVACHLKDVVMIAAEHSPDGVPTVMGVPLGQGSLDLAGLTQALVSTGLRRISLQNVWGYHVPLGKLRPIDPLDLPAGGAFAYAAHPSHRTTSPSIPKGTGRQPTWSPARPKPSTSPPRMPRSSSQDSTPDKERSMSADAVHSQPSAANDVGGDAGTGHALVDPVDGLGDGEVAVRGVADPAGIRTQATRRRDLATSK